MFKRLLSPPSSSPPAPMPRRRRDLQAHPTHTNVLASLEPLRFSTQRSDFQARSTAPLVYDDADVASPASR